MNITKKHVAWFLASVFAFVALPYASYSLGHKNGVQSVLEPLEMICTRQGTMYFPSGRSAMCFGIPTDDYVEKNEEKVRKGLDKYTEV